MSRYLPIGVEVSDYESAKVAMRFATALLLPLRQSTDARSPSRWACRTLCDHRSVVRSLTIAVLLRALLRNRLHLTLPQMIPGTTHCALSATLSVRSVDRNMRSLSFSRLTLRYGHGVTLLHVPRCNLLLWLATITRLKGVMNSGTDLVPVVRLLSRSVLREPL